MQLAVVRPRAFRKNEDGVVLLEQFERRANSAQRTALAVDRHGAERTNPQIERKEKQAHSREILQLPRARQANQHRVEIALVIRNNQHRARERHETLARKAIAKQYLADRIAGAPQNGVPKPG